MRLPVFQEYGFRIALEARPLVQSTQYVLGDNPLEILFLALDAVTRAPVGLYKLQRDDRIYIALLDNIAALRSLKLVEDLVVDMINVFHRVPRLYRPQLRIFRLLNGS